MDKTTQYAAQLDEISAMRHLGIPVATIAQDLGIPYDHLVAVVRAQGLPIRPGNRTTVQEMKLQQLLDEGATHTQAAQALGVSENTILRRVHQWGLQSSRRGPRSGQGHQCWKGGRRRDTDGYIRIWAPLHPECARLNASVLEHRLVMEVVLGRLLRYHEVVHHIDGNPSHNWPSNLEVFADNASHLRHELSGRGYASSHRPIDDDSTRRRTKRPCPSARETLAQCPSETRRQLAYYTESFRPTLAHRTEAKRTILRSGARRDPFGWPSTV